MDNMFSGFDLKQHTLILTKTGSQVYGTALPTSDIDVRGVTTAPIEYYLGIYKRFTETSDFELKDLVDVPFESRDVQVMDLLKYAKLAADANPNVLELLFIPQEHWLLVTDSWHQMREIRHAFLSKKCRHTFSGYAHAQLQRILTHRHWLLNTPTNKPERKDFGLPEAPLISQDQLGAANALVDRVYQGWVVSPEEEIPQNVLNKLRSSVHSMVVELSKDKEDAEEKKDVVFRAAARKAGLGDSLIEVVSREKRYRAAMCSWTQYQSWKTNRNAVRSELEAKFGFDTKHGSHLVRLYRMGLEVLETRELYVDRRGIDADELMAIRRGEWSFDRLLEFAKDMDVKIEAAEANSKLPRSSDKETIDAVCIDIFKKAHSLA